MRHRALLVGDIEENWVLKSLSDTPSSQNICGGDLSQLLYIYILWS